MNILNKLGFYKNDEMLKTDPTKAIPISEQNRLKKAGYEVIGATMELWKDESNIETGCCSSSAIDDARNVCNKLGIEHYVLDCKKEFRKYAMGTEICRNGL